jgi:CRP-like cAMP-binding protein
MSLEEDATLLAKVELFANVAPRRLKLLALASSRVLFAAGQNLCVEGDEGYEAFIVISGEADVKIKTPSGVATVARLKRNDIVGEMAILREMPRNATVTAASDVTTLRIGKQDFLNLMKEFPEVTVAVMRSLAERLARTTSELANARAAAKGAGAS